MRTYIGILLLTTLTGISKLDNSKTLDVKLFTIESKQSWKYIPKRGIDSFVGEIALDKKDTLSFAYGLYSSDLEESFDYYVKDGDSLFLRDYEKDEEDTINSPHYKFHSLGGKKKLEDFKENITHYENIAGLNAKVVTPKINGIGMTGIYFESTNPSGKGMSFNIYGYNLSKKNQKLFMIAVKTIKFKK